jgi:CheY-like chemotaxis protein
VRILRATGYRVVDAGSPEEAVGLARTEPRIDLLLTDMVMPGMSGRDLSRKLHKDRPDLRVVYMTGYSEELVASEAKLDGPLLQKPFTRDSLLSKVAAAVGANVRKKDSPSPIA